MTTTSNQRLDPDLHRRRFSRTLTSMPKDWEFSDDPKAAPHSSGGSGYVLSPDVTDPTAVLLIVDPANGSVVEQVKGGIEFATIESGNGVNRLRRADGNQIEQYPGIYGGFSFVPGSGAYGRCIVEGAIVTFRSRPEDPIYSYTVARFP